MNHRTGKEYKLRMTFNNSIASWPCLVFLESLPSIDRSGSVKDRRFPNMHLTWYEWFRAPILKVISKKTYSFSPKVLSNESIFSPQKEVRMIFLIGTGSFFSHDLSDKSFSVGAVDCASCLGWGTSVSTTSPGLIWNLTFPWSLRLLGCETLGILLNFDVGIPLLITFKHV
jgi:hypothetical protein